MLIASFIIKCWSFLYLIKGSNVQRQGLIGKYISMLLYQYQLLVLIYRIHLILPIYYFYWLCCQKTPVNPCVDRSASRLGTESDPAANKEGVSQRGLVSLGTLRVLPDAPLYRFLCTQAAEYLVVYQQYYYPVTSSGYCRPLPTNMLHSSALDLTQFNTYPCK